MCSIPHAFKVENGVLHWAGLITQYDIIVCIYFHESNQQSKTLLAMFVPSFVPGNIARIGSNSGMPEVLLNWQQSHETTDKAFDNAPDFFFFNFYEFVCANAFLVWIDYCVWQLLSLQLLFGFTKRNVFKDISTYIHTHTDLVIFVFFCLQDWQLSNWHRP